MGIRKALIICSVCVFAVFGLLLAGCGAQNAAPADPQASPAGAPAVPQPAPGGADEPPECGGTSDYSDPNAAKEIKSKDITSFSCTASLLSLMLEDHPFLSSDRYEFSAKTSGGAVECGFISVRGEKTFEAGAELLAKVQDIIDRYGLAKLNGTDVFTHGLPDDFGASLSVAYASGEKIYASHNTDMFIPLDALEELVRLFGGGPSFEMITPEEAMEIMDSEEDYILLDVRRYDEFDSGHIPGAVCVPNEEIEDGKRLEGYSYPHTPMLVYCRSGRRSKEAAQKLANAGYSRVYEFGGILDWPGEIETY